jgi:hypothetical protein
VQLADAAVNNRGSFPPLPSAAQQHQLALTDTNGTALDWARALRAIAGGQALPAQAASIVRDLLNWPLRAFPQNRAEFDDYMTKGGSLPGVITEASYIHPRTVARGTTVVIFFRRLPQNIQDALQKTFVHQEFMRTIASDPTFAAKVRTRLLQPT